MTYGIFVSLLPGVQACLHCRGLFLKLHAVQRVVVFIDYQNAFRGARGLFFEGEPQNVSAGQFDPLGLGLLLVKRGLPGRELREVRVYRGLPNPTKDPTGHSAARSQIRHWQKDSRVVVVTRPLRYPKANEKATAPSEKGIDVQLAVDFATMAVRQRYDIGVLFSRDTDLLPPLEFVFSVDVTARCEVASWRSGENHLGRLTIGNQLPYCHWLSAEDFALIADPTDYRKRS